MLALWVQATLGIPRFLDIFVSVQNMAGNTMQDKGKL